MISDWPSLKSRRIGPLVPQFLHATTRYHSPGSQTCKGIGGTPSIKLVGLSGIRYELVGQSIQDKSGTARKKVPPSLIPYFKVITLLKNKTDPHIRASPFASNRKKSGNASPQRRRSSRATEIPPFGTCILPSRVGPQKAGRCHLLSPHTLSETTNESLIL
jgi:hypothetical protein